MKKQIISTALSILFLSPVPAWSGLPEVLLETADPGPVIGENRPYLIGPGETLVEIAYRAGIGYMALTSANPGIDPWVPRVGQEILLPFATILPKGAGKGISINLAELKLYYIRPGGERLKASVYPIAIGSEGRDTPEGDYAVSRKIKDPAWTVPPSIRKERPWYPAMVPPGPDNPLGEYWIEFSDRGYGIHGTNEPFGVGRRVSHGCVRLYDRHIRGLFAEVPLGTPIRIFYEPVKVGLKEGKLLAEIHPDYLGRREDPLGEVLRRARELNWQGEINWEELFRALKETRGVPVVISAPDSAGREKGGPAAHGGPAPPKG